MSDLNQRIEAMYRARRRVPGASWPACGCVILVRDRHVLAVHSRRGLRIILVIAAAAVLIFNTASMGAMVKHYKEDKDFIYGLDIKHLDEMRGKKH